ncbi:hypothetical protein [Fodinibius halophilus]|uniref:Hemerythrin-like domain-containing protein n=1 Tax=Fodinibius halophilus TaxID=1736908 RepID=A0A6M1T9L8_9BACT|nr:hypothetical protein [Fodinibius halophilus]NGP88731.1 hypothetical protein [Fodinibius halophilus]
MDNSQSLKDLTPDATIGQIINAEKNAEELLTSIGLSPEHHKPETLRSICQQKKWSEVEILQWLKKNQQNNGEQNVDNNKGLPNLNDNLKRWCNYLKKHFITKNSGLLDEISSDFPRIHKIHGNQYQWLKNMQPHLEKLEEKLTYYFYFQRHKLFPLLHELNSSKKKILHGTTTKIESGIHIIEEDHNEIIDFIETIEQKGQGLKNPEGACSTLRILNYNIKALFSSLKKQIEIERDHFIPLVKQKLNSG